MRMNPNGTQTTKSEREAALRQYLGFLAEFADRNGRPSVEGLLLEHGKVYEWKPLPEGFEYAPRARTLNGRKVSTTARRGFVLMDAVR